MSENPMRVGVVGFGYWGPNLVRNFTANVGTQVVCVADRDGKRRAAAETQYPGMSTVADAEVLFADPSIEAVAIATPLFTHFPLAKAALLAGKHVLVEKPLAGSVAECEELVALAAEQGKALMVDHTFLFTGAVRKVREVIQSGSLGRILYFDSVRINLGLFQPDFNVVWDLAPHDLSILDFVLEREPRWVSAIGVSHYGKHENLAYLTIGFDDDLMAHVHCNWMAPVKTRRITIAGTDRMLVYDDTEPSERVKIYEHGVDWREPMETETKYRLNVQYRTGDVLAPKLDPREALRMVIETFEQACRTGESPVSSGSTGVRVVRLLEAAQKSMNAQGARVSL
ncbi:MAG TPA: Gfo/Idh/MocA family oxidoreductase [Kofleriaceae bacterium]|nr:Gfo/Idh/MocA family oxidoreductase [Kofleriaceae bacterium]